MGSAYAGSDLEESRRNLTRAVDLARSIGNQYVEGMALSELGSVLAREGELDAAKEILIDAMEVFEQLGDHPHEWTTIRYLAVVHARTGSPEVATRLLAAADAAGVNPLSSQMTLWSEVFEGLETIDDHDSWAEEGSRMDLKEATKLALAG